MKADKKYLRGQKRELLQSKGSVYLKLPDFPRGKARILK